MARRWRWTLLVVIAVAVIGGFMPGRVFSSPIMLRAPAVISAQETPISPCMASCGKGAPSPATPTAGIVALSTLAAAVFVTLARRRNRRRHLVVAALPRGSALPLFHPPQFS